MLLSNEYDVISEIQATYPHEALEDMIKYNERLEDAIRNESLIVPNEGANHASLMMTKLFEHTRNEVAMVVGGFTGKVSDKPNYLRALSSLLEKGNVRVRVILLDDANEDSKALKLLKDYRDKFALAGKQLISIKTANAETKDILKNASIIRDRLVHFSVFDNDKFRFEYDPEDYAAFGSFKNQRKALKLLGDFNQAFRSVSATAEYK